VGGRHRATGSAARRAGAVRGDAGATGAGPTEPEPLDYVTLVDQEHDARRNKRRRGVG